MSSWYFGHLTLIQGMLISIPLAMSVQIALRSGVFSFASIGFYGIGAYGTGILVIRDWPVLPAIALMVVVSGLVAYFMSIPLIRLRGLYLGMVTFAFDLILTVVATNGGELTGGALGLLGVPLGVGTGGLLAAAVFAVLLVSQLERRAVGRALVGIKNSEELVMSVGVDLKRRKRIVFAISGALGALSGSLYVLTFSTVQPTSAGFTLIITTLTMAVIGGTSSWIGAVIGTIIITWLPSLAATIGEYQHLVYGVVLVLVVMYAPEGVLGALRWLWQRVAPGLRAARPPGPAPAGVAPAAPPPVGDPTTTAEPVAADRAKGAAR
ncbi:branched-chain amino acid ABC transporter permease [Dactylosporangium sucinum]|uniref:Branched-chain amino acid ABC transporter permease n=1 Tax=Dactylosporangium sucinum TaxID=1424081 RepID=A0A917WQH2_9ACTN|nr:branched-chain amino acid ABC transporter permease [Dactylosporangium sucinum]GGM20710.1 branched-chain amino acid ABC transporter permease [Dactylosporangium sucinum]